MNSDPFLNKIKKTLFFAKRKSASVETDQKLIFQLRDRHLKFNQLKHLFKILSPEEKKIIHFLSVLIFICLIFMGTIFCINHIAEVPSTKGEYITGIVGYPQLINPLFSQANDVDSDIAKLTFSGLLNYDKNLNLTPDLALSYSISDDQKTYTFKLRPDAFWHNGEQLTVDDVIFTIEAIKNPEYKSPLYRTFKTVEVVKTDGQTVEFKLQEPYAPFLNILTFGIISQNIWNTTSPQNASLATYNLKPAGSGMFKFKSVVRDATGNIKSYTLARNESYYGVKPYLETLIFKFYPDIESALFALKTKEIQGLNFLPRTLKNELANHNAVQIKSLSLPQYTAVFFNQNHNELLENINIRLALTFAVNKKILLDENLYNDGIIIDGPILPGFIGYNPQIQKYDYNPQEANKLLDEMKWEKISSDAFIEKERQRIDTEIRKQNEELGKLQSAEAKEGEEETKKENIRHINEDKESLNKKMADLESYKTQTFYREKDGKLLSLELATINTENNLNTANSIIKFWKDLGIFTSLKIVEPADIEKEILKPRNYDCLLYGEIIGADPDPYPFWHSSQNKYPGLNLAVFSNKEVDKLLEDARQINDPQKRKDKYIHFQNILVQELPAIFLYSPAYTYVLSSELKGFDIQRINLPQDRFNNIEEWYIKTKKIWK